MVKDKVEELAVARLLENLKAWLTVVFNRQLIMIIAVG